MDFLDKLFSIQNFGIYLFIVIGILVILFVMVLFFGAKDSKPKDKKVKEDKNTDESKPVFTTETEEPKEENLKTYDVPNPFEMNISEDKVASFVEPSFEPQPDSFIPAEEKTINEEPINSKEAIEETKEFDFDALAAAITKELDSLGKNTEASPAPKANEEEPLIKEEFTMPSINLEPKLEEIKDFNIPEEQTKNTPKEVAAPIKEELTNPVLTEEKEAPLNIFTEGKEEPVKQVPRPEVFSSVYVSREEKKEEVKPVEVSKPSIELPKKIELPRRK